MNKTILRSKCIFIVITLLFISSFAFSQTTKYRNWNGVFFEIRPDTSNAYRYTEDNETYKGRNKYYYNYEYVNSLGKEFYYVVDHSTRNWTWDFVPKEDTLGSAVVLIKMTVLPDLGHEDFRKSNPDYDQSVIIHKYSTKNGDELPMYSITGLVENEKNIWMHPPRNYFFQILQINPFPFIQRPYKKGNRWKWSLDIGEWGDPRWKTWKGQITNKYTYEITDTNSIVHTPMGDLVCYKIESQAKSRIGKTYLTSYFNTEYGFVRLEYTNIDTSKLVIQLQKVEKKD